MKIVQHKIDSPAARTKAFQEIWDKATQTETAIANIASRLNSNHPEVKIIYTKYLSQLKTSITNLKELVRPEIFKTSTPKINSNPTEYAALLQNIINISQKTTFSLFQLQDQTIWK